MNPELISCGVNVAEVKIVLRNKKIVKTFYRLGSVFLLVFFSFGLPGYSGCSRRVPKCSAGCSGIPGFKTSHCSHCCNKRYGMIKAKAVNKC